jgi:hypothetical protein
MMRASAGLAGHFLFMEDDFLLCPHALRALAYVTSKAHAYYPGVRGYTHTHASAHNQRDREQ